MSVIPADAFVIIIGAMKCGTTTLYDNLIKHEEFCPAKDKEPHFFAKATNRFTRPGRYEQLWNFQPKVHQYAIEASTGYTKYPLEAGVPQRVHAYGLKPKFIYIVRDPFMRIESEINFLNTRHESVSYTHLRAHETKANLVCRLLLEKKNKQYKTTE